MRRSVRAALVLLVASTAGANDALTTVDACLARLDPRSDIGYERIAARCPALRPALEQSAAAAWLPAGWDQPDNTLTAGDLGDLRVLLERELSEPGPRAYRPDPGALPAVLAALAPSKETQRGWWARFKDWLRQVFGARPRTAGQSAFGEWLGRLELSQGVLGLIRWLALGAVVAIALAVIVNELRIAGLLREREARGRRSSAAPREHTGSELELLERAPAQARPGLLLELVAARLTELGRVPPARALTAHELVRKARLPDEQARGDLAQLAGVSERVRFAAGELGAERVAEAVTLGQRLLAGLRAG